MKNKNVIILIIALLTISFQSHACSMFVIKKDGKVMVGNNEDFYNQNSRMWFEKGNKNEFGVVYVGFDDLWPQGAINDKGLVFDGFAMPNLEIKDFEGKDSPEHEDFLQFIMRTCSKVEEVKDIFLKWDLRGMETSMFYFVDKSGKQLIVEGDFIEIRNQSYDIISNFYPSQCDNLNDVTIEFYQKGRKLIETKQETSVSFCTSLLDSLHQESSWGGGTLYSTLYDLNEGIIYLYYNHNFNNVITINIKEELQKENHIIEIPKLFPDNKKGQEFYKNYNETISKIEELGYAKTISCSENISELEKFFNNVQKITIYREYFDKAADKWEETEDFKSAIKVYEVMAMFFPDDYQIYYKLGEANFNLKLYNKALLNYQECSKLIPENEKLKEKINAVKELIE
ncbi:MULTISPECIES: hypothetical protein [unclassified Lentimicrobium]|uniref:hypothetical protein n=1 Tax=unclassified Lentimicrobium TaxID=2677434 RepID=UPI001C132715|nr:MULTISPECIES: hypothetical protein [unclassified Lentimicrobium]